jgi:hypothetical protein
VASSYEEGSPSDKTNKTLELRPLQMKPVKTHTFNGKRHHIYVDEPPLGICFNSVEGKSNNEIYIMTSLKDKWGLITAIHESLHAEKWSAHEETVDRTSKEIGNFLWRLGYRWKPEEL